LTNHKHLGFDDIEKYMGTNSSDEFEEGFLDYFEECLDICESCQDRFRTWMFLDSLAGSTLEDSMPDIDASTNKEQPAQDILLIVTTVDKLVIKYAYLNKEDISNIRRTNLPDNKLHLKAAS
jgi:hypothetical protein